MNNEVITQTGQLQTITAPADTSRTSAGNLMMDVATMQSLMKVADLMASGRSTVPAHLQKNPADCMAVVMQAMQWGLNPFAVAQKTHIVSGTLGYEAQLVNAVVQTSGTIQGRFHYEYKGAPGSIECRVGAVIKGESEITWNEWLSEAKVTTKNSPLWKTNPRQQMGYLQVKNWARLYCPGAILGVYSPDEFDQPQPRNMGQADVVHTAPQPLAPGVLESAQNAAEEGVATYSAFWKAASAETRRAIGKDEHQRLKDVAIAADAKRTVNAAQPEPAATEQRQPKSFDDVLSRLVAASDIDALFMAGEWIGDITDKQDREILEGKFDELKSQLEAA